MMVHDFDIAVIGAGSGGLTVAAAAAQFGQRVVLFEKGEMGGDCLNYGCVPSKALLSAAKQAQAVRSGAAYGIAAQEPQVDFAKVMAHVRRAIAAIAPNDSQERFEKLGVRVVRAEVRFRDATAIEAEGLSYTARRMVIATGSRAAVPPVPGLDQVPYLTNESIFENHVLPRHLLIIGGGPIGMEMAQAHRRLGSKVTVIEAFEPLAKDDPELTAIVLEKLKAEGIAILARASITLVSQVADGIAIDVQDHGRISGSHLLVAAGRQPNIEGLNLEVGTGEVHAIMGPNGSGKSTLANALLGNEAYSVESGTVRFRGDDITDWATDARAKAGMFLAFQYPEEIPGVTVINFLRQALSARKGLELSTLELRLSIREWMARLEMDPAFADRYLNEGFSGGEKKRNEILQMAILEPDFAILDETDSGLDIDALRVVAKGVQEVRRDRPQLGVLLITHYQRLLDYLTPDVIHILIDGSIVASGGPELAKQLESDGYEAFR